MSPISRTASVLAVSLMCLAVIVATPARARAASNEAFSIPLSASTTTAGDSSLVFAMGHLNNPANTFWELFSSTTDGRTWRLRTPPGVASNGGLSQSVTAEGTLTVGFLPAGGLKFSPVARSDAGKLAWTAGALPSSLSSVANDLTSTSAKGVVALVTHKGQSVLSSAGSLWTWTTLATTAELRSAGSSCGESRATAVASDSRGETFVGLECESAKRLGVLGGVTTSNSVTTWKLSGPKVSIEPVSSVVLRLQAVPQGLAGIGEFRSRDQTSVVAFWRSSTSSTWNVSPARRVPTGWSVSATSIGGASGQEIAIVLSDGIERKVSVVTQPSSRWSDIASAPEGCSGVTVIGKRSFCFVVATSRLSIWEAATTSSAWILASSRTVPVPYGSSS